VSNPSSPRGSSARGLSEVGAGGVSIHDRPEFVRTPANAIQVGAIDRPLSIFERLWNIDGVRKATVVIAFLLSWELYTRIANVPPIVFPSFTATVAALWSALVDGGLLAKIGFTLKVLLYGYAVGLTVAAVLVSLAVTWRPWADILTTATAMFNPLPAIAILPLAMLWFGLGTRTLVFVLVHAVVWAVALNAYVGFQGVSQTLRMVGRNYGLRNLRFVAKVLIPAAFATILSGLKIGWAFAWRTIIGAELVVGAASGSGGIGWHIFDNSERLETAQVFAGLLTIILIGVMVENVIFRNVELRTVHRWGMQR
jgi:NitT/TauT family transport system permease protein